MLMNNQLTHYGVKGMRWRHRKAGQTRDWVAPSGQKYKGRYDDKGILKVKLEDGTVLNIRDKTDTALVAAGVIIAGAVLKKIGSDTLSSLMNR